MADVYRAYQPGMERNVAIKVMHDYLAGDEDFVERFRREARAVGMLRHPHIVQVIDFDTQGDLYYMVMEYIQGRTLKAILRERGALLPGEALSIAIKLADALAYAHGQGMLHRDIKPANIMIAPDGEPVLMDFGIARILGSTQLTSSHTLLGTPSYMSPEAGLGEMVDARTDIYSLGIVLYEMLAGQLPFDADTPYAIIFKHVNEPLPPLSAYATDIPRAVETVLAQALAKDRDARYPTAADFRDALAALQFESFARTPTRISVPTRVANAQTINLGNFAPDALDGSRAETPRSLPTRSLPARRMPRRLRRIALLGGSVVIIAVTTAIAFALSSQGQVVVAFGPPATPSQTATAIHRPSNTPTPTELPTRTPTITPSETPTDLPTEIPSEMPTETPTDEPTHEPTPEPTTTSGAVGTLIAQAGELSQQGKNAEALEALNQAIALAPDDPTAYATRGHYNFWMGNYDQARADYEQALKLAPDTSLHGWLAACYLLLDQRFAAYDLYSNTLAVEPAAPAWYLANAAFVAQSVGNVAKAREWSAGALALEADQPAALYAEALIAWGETRHEAALETLDKVIQSDPAQYEYPFLNPMFDRNARIDRARLLAALGRDREAIQAYTEAEDVYRDWWARPYIELAELYRKLGRYTEALRALQSALQIAENLGDTELRDKLLQEISRIRGRRREPTPTPYEVPQSTPANSSEPGAPPPTDRPAPTEPSVILPEPTSAPTDRPTDPPLENLTTALPPVEPTILSPLSGNQG